MNKAVGILVSAILLVAMVPLVLASTPVSVENPISVIIDSRADSPECWMDPNSRVVLLNPADGSVIAVDRTQNYAFQGEQIIYDIVCQDRNGHEDINNVHMIVTDDDACIQQIRECDETCEISQLDCSDYEEAECVQNSRTDDPGSIGARDENGNYIVWDSTTMLWYTCALSVETSNSMYGEYWVFAEACDKGSGSSRQVLCDHIDEVENWCFNPVVALEYYPTDGIDFGTVLPGTRAYSDPLHVINVPDEECGQAAELRMTISGTDFYDPTNSGARCPSSNVLLLSNFAYYATQGAYSTWTNIGADVEGYDTIPYETGDPDDREPVIDANQVLQGGSELTVVFRLDLPRPCIGNFQDGAIYFWGEAI